MIPGLPSFGGTELLILLAIVLLLFGAKRIPELARSLGRGTREYREVISGDYDEAEPSNPKEDKKTPSGDVASAERGARAEQEL